MMVFRRYWLEAPGQSVDICRRRQKKKESFLYRSTRLPFVRARACVGVQCAQQKYWIWEALVVQFSRDIFVDTCVARRLCCDFPSVMKNNQFWKNRILLVLIVGVLSFIKCVIGCTRHSIGEMCSISCMAVVV